MKIFQLIKRFDTDNNYKYEYEYFIKYEDAEKKKKELVENVNALMGFVKNNMLFKIEEIYVQE